jgi:hypothetical protein
MFFCCVCRAGSDLCKGLITLSVESYLICVSNCVLSRNLKTRGPMPNLGCSVKKKKKKKKLFPIAPGFLIIRKKMKKEKRSSFDSTP